MSRCRAPIAAAVAIPGFASHSPSKAYSAKTWKTAATLSANASTSMMKTIAVVFGTRVWASAALMRIIAMHPPPP